MLTDVNHLWLPSAVLLIIVSNAVVVTLGTADLPYCLRWCKRQHWRDNDCNLSRPTVSLWICLTSAVFFTISVTTILLTCFWNCRSSVCLCTGFCSSQLDDFSRLCKGRTLSRHSHHKGARVHGAHQAASHVPALYLPSYSGYLFTDPERTEGWVSPGPGCKEQLAHGCYATARSQRDSNPRPRGRWSRALTTRPPRHPNTDYLLRFYIIPVMSYKHYLHHQQITIII